MMILERDGSVFSDDGARWRMVALSSFLKPLADMTLAVVGGMRGLLKQRSRKYTL